MPIGGKEEYDERIARSRDLPTVIYENMRRFSNNMFLLDGLTGISRTFKEVLNDALGIAVKLREMGVGDGSFITFLTDSTIEAYTIAIAVWLAGGCVTAINAALTADEVAQILDISMATLVFCEGEKLPLLEEARNFYKRPLRIITDAKHETYTSCGDLLCDGSAFTPDAYDPDQHVALVLFTSGTTGVPKGVMLSSSACLNNAIRVFEEDSPTFMTTPFYWLSNPSGFVNAMLHGIQFIFPRVKYITGTLTPDLRHILECIAKYKPAKWMSGPSILLELSCLPDVKNYNLSSMTHLSVGGSPILPLQKKFICESLFNGRNIIQERYGCTEAGFFTRQWKFPPPDFEDKKSASIGPVSPGVELMLIDVETGKEVGPNEEGEVFVRGNGNMIGYINADMPQRYTTKDWYRVGDCCTYDEDEWIYFKARTKDLIKYRGHHMVPLDVEKVAIQHPDVLEVCVVGKPHPIDGEHPAAFVVRKAGSTVTEESLTAFINGKLGEMKRLRGGVIFKNELPKSRVGKVLRKKLLDEFQP